MESYTVITSDFVKIDITNSGNNLVCVERRFQKDITIRQFKEKLELLTGGKSNSMVLEAYDKKNQPICKLDDNDRLLGSYPIDDGMRVHVIDNFPKLEDAMEIAKFELSQEEYSKRSDTVKAFLEKNRIGKYNEEDMKKKQEEKQQELEMDEKAICKMSMGQRCEVNAPSNPKRRGTVMYLGKTDFKEGWWVGIKYDEPLGKNNGTVNGKKYFECPPNYGGFVKPIYVSVGNFPEDDYDLDEEI